MKTKTNFLRLRSIKQAFIFFLLLFFWLTLLPPSVGAKTTSEIAASKAKKVVMMLDIMTKEYELGIENGKIINAMEYEESRVFLEQALGRYKIIIDYMPNPNIAEELKTRFEILVVNLKNKNDPREIKISVNTIQSQLLKELGIEIQKSPLQAINIQNGQNIFKANCAQCHGLTGN